MRIFLVILYIMFMLLQGCSTPFTEKSGPKNTLPDNFYRNFIDELIAKGEAGYSVAPLENRDYRQEEQTKQFTKIAILVPLSGKYKNIGKDLLNAAQFALYNFNDPNIVLIPFDTQGTSYGTVDAATRAVNENVAVILGPLFSDSALAIAPIAQEAGINIISFSNDKKLSGSGVFTLGFQPENQIRRILRYAVFNDIENFTALFPGDQYGAVAAKEMRLTLKEFENTAILRTEIYAADKKGKPLNLSSHVYAAYNAAMKNRPAKDYNEELKKYNDVPIEYPRAMLIAEGGDNLLQIIALLQKYKLDNSKIQLLGASSWYENELLKYDILDGAIFASPQREKQEIFKDNYKAVFGYKPAGVASLAYDAVALAVTLKKIHNRNPYAKENILDEKGFVGVDGIFRFRVDGLTERGLAVIQIKNKEFITIDQPPQNFYEIEKLHQSFTIENDSED